MEEQEAETEGDSVHQGKTTPKSMAPETPLLLSPPNSSINYKAVAENLSTD